MVFDKIIGNGHEADESALGAINRPLRACGAGAIDRPVAGLSGMDRSIAVLR
ncbi:MAG TPA: hypothetical protein VFA09_21990 [Ktedonobacteraceae bacterium]|nr:hypothetical protein [Ktedonobacteraceae bacterium]